MIKALILAAFIGTAITPVPIAQVPSRYATNSTITIYRIADPDYGVVCYVTAFMKSSQGFMPPTISCVKTEQKDERHK